MLVLDLDEEGRLKWDEVIFWEKFLVLKYFFFLCEINIKIGLTLIGINVICEVPFYFVCICQKYYIISV